MNELGAKLSIAVIE